MILLETTKSKEIGPQIMDTPLELSLEAGAKLGVETKSDVSIHNLNNTCIHSDQSLDKHSVKILSFLILMIASLIMALTSVDSINSQLFASLGIISGAYAIKIMSNPNSISDEK